ncbi:hypothetical protein BJ508DRAFT_414620 [Ascobolus immersus RN42]|uniref:Malate dehydrogenase n=1 Tax=Ascobolus immersus RN42 TaxID=1160509 RepID=A0A3N4I6J8_ASCIM|nr:hypothetical protein BJ508DRAFT_414620 [Ascobolus immersus RN42]
MQFLTLLTLGASLLTSVTAAPAPKVDLIGALLKRVSTIQASAANLCQNELNKAKFPIDKVPSDFFIPGLQLKKVVVGRGTQNYTCETSTAASVPALKGAIATLFDTSCLAAFTPTFLHSLSPELLSYPLSSVSSKTAQALTSGSHYFLLKKTPIFDFRPQNGIDVPAPAVIQGGASVGPEKMHEYTPAGSTPAPAGAPAGSNKLGAVDWLRLDNDGLRDQSYTKVYRINTAGGKAPANCEGAKAEFTVDYAAEYWFYQ